MTAMIENKKKYMKQHVKKIRPALVVFPSCARDACSTYLQTNRPGTSDFPLKNAWFHEGQTYIRTNLEKAQ